MLGYSLNYLIDMQNAVIVDVEATPTHISKEVDATETMIERSAIMMATLAQSESLFLIPRGAFGLPPQRAE